MIRHLRPRVLQLKQSLAASLADWRQDRDGFSLVELAIVLIIIGLIIGGVLKGQDLIQSARINSLQADVNEIRTAASTFQGKYDNLPGDLTSAGEALLPSTYTPVGKGNGDGQVGGALDPTSGGTGGTGGYRLGSAADETTLFWLQLSVTGLVTGVQNQNNTTGIMTTAAMKQAKTGGVFSIDYQTKPGFGGSAGDTASTGPAGHWILIASTNDTGSTWGPVISGVSMRSLDIKGDDGNPINGVIQARKGTAANSGDCYTTNATSGVATYSNTDAVTCTVWMKM